MGSYYDVKCSECGYEFHAVYGRPGISKKERKVIKAIEDGTRTDELAQVYKTMERPRIEVNSVPFFCKQCRILFNYDATMISGKYGKYDEHIAYCPYCNEISYYPISQRIFFKDQDKPICPCPKCDKFELRITASGIYD